MWPHRTVDHFQTPVVIILKRLKREVSTNKPVCVRLVEIIYPECVKVLAFLRGRPENGVLLIVHGSKKYNSLNVVIPTHMPEFWYCTFQWVLCYYELLQFSETWKPFKNSILVFNLNIFLFSRPTAIRDYMTLPGTNVALMYSLPSIPGFGVIDTLYASVQTLSIFRFFPKLNDFNAADW